MLRTALGPLLLAKLEDPGVAEVILNADGQVWVDRFDLDMVPAGLSLSSADGERILRLVWVHHVEQDHRLLRSAGQGRVFGKDGLVENIQLQADVLNHCGT